jgi:predicted lipoprotein with Yx(FWY)xxD motif
MSSRLQHGARLVRLLALSLGVLALTGLTAVALARTAVLAIAPHAPVTNRAGRTVKEAIVITAHGRAVYTLTGDSPRHPKCTAASGCLAAWPPVTVRTTHGLVKPARVSGRLTVWRHGGVDQLVLGGHPLYTFIGDRHLRAATGEGVVSFGGTWHVVRPRSRGSSASAGGGW